MFELVLINAHIFVLKNNSHLCLQYNTENPFKRTLFLKLKPCLKKFLTIKHELIFDPRPLRYINFKENINMYFLRRYKNAFSKKVSKKTFLADSIKIHV